MDLQQTADRLTERLGQRAKLGIILGSGLGDYYESMTDTIVIPYGEIEGFPESTVPGHAGEWIMGRLFGIPTVMMRGRFHIYEGHPAQIVALPIRVMRAMGVEKLIVTNACGGIREDFAAGDLMLIEDQINFAGYNPLIGPNDERWGPRFPDMSRAYDPFLLKLAQEVAADLGIPLQKGVYAMMSGPSFETPAEIRMLRALGADAVGMSTVPEVIAANHCGIQVLGISCVTNKAADGKGEPLNHEEVLEAGRRVAASFRKLLNGITKRLTF
ncbi:purine-nucleoside phosphorylase [Gehongia tenuis]|uniref:Purine nucleoside phosphorylase n=1 Tax=Gehongia tenuis TaxID=2763655 RepID=A0A926HPG2_9FIRM|nr:purine-nucleoside phosphorylase [Gehongia tenuis]MBC8531183.1 purine-nucleoside phosphorylase [Gehongia tenuis]